MIISTTPTLTTHEITAYRGIVTGEAIIGTNAVRDVLANVSDFFGGRSGAYEKSLAEARSTALKEMQESAAELDANGVVGVDIDYEVINNMLMVSATGTAVVLG